MQATCFSCRVDIPWGLGDPVVSATKVQNKLNLFIAGLKPPNPVGTLVPGSSPPSFAVFCADCWGSRMHFSAQQVLDGAAPPAQTLGESKGGLETAGISFCAQHKAFLDNQLKVQYPSIIAILVHEMCHWFSHNHQGLQESPGKGYWGINWDEMVTDYLASNIFPIVITEPYAKLTFYNNDFNVMPKLFSGAFKTTSKLSGFKGETWHAATAKVAALNQPDLSAFLEALVGEKDSAVGWYFSKFYFSDPAKVKQFFDCFIDLKTVIISNSVFTATLQQETEYQVSCAHGVKRPTRGVANAGAEEKKL
jgi:hypothetical protein